MQVCQDLKQSTSCHHFENINSQVRDLAAPVEKNPIFSINNLNIFSVANFPRLAKGKMLENKCKNNFIPMIIFPSAKCFSGFSVGCRINEKKVICYQLELRKELADISTECFNNFSLMTTAAFSRNVGKLFSQLS